MAEPCCGNCQLFRTIKNTCSLSLLNAKPTDYCLRWIPTYQHLRFFPGDFNAKERDCLWCGGTGTYREWVKDIDSEGPVLSYEIGYCHKCGTFSLDRVPKHKTVLKKRKIKRRKIRNDNFPVCPICESSKREIRPNDMFECLECGELYWKEIKNMIDGRLQ